MATATRNGKPKTQPVHRVRVGTTTATVWENQGESGPWYNTTVSRTYRTEEESYEETNSYGESQLLELSAAANLAHAWIIARHAERRSEARERD